MFKGIAHRRCLLALVVLSACGDDDQARESPDSGVVLAAEAADSSVEPTSDAAMACPAPLEGCGAECVDTRSSARHCGACAVACDHGERCAAGRCEGCEPHALSGPLPIEVQVDTREGDDVVRGSCGLGEAPEALFAFTAPHAGKFAFSTAGSLFNTVLYVLDERCGGAELACSDDRGGGLASMIELDLERDQTITVVVDGFEGQAGQARLEVSELAQSTCCTARTEPGCGVTFFEACVCAQDDFCCTFAWDDACTALAASEACSACGDAPDACQPAADAGAVPATLASAIAEMDRVAPSCASAAAPEALLAFTAPADGLYEFDTSGSGVADTILAVFDGATCAGAEIACVDDLGDALMARASLQLTAGQQVLIAVESWDLERGEIEVRVGEGGDDVAQVCDAELLTGVLPLSAVADISSGASLIEPSCATFGSAGEALFAFTAPAAARYRFDTAGSTADTIVQVLDGSCAGTELACNDDPSEASLAAMVEVELTAEQTVIVNVDSVLAEGSFELSVSEVP